MINLITDNGISAFIEELSEGDAVLKDILNQALARALKKDTAGMKYVTRYPADAPEWLTKEKFEKQGPFHVFDGALARRNAPFMQKVNHIADWARAAAANNPRWLQEKDEQGRLKRLKDFGTLELILTLVNKDVRKDNQRLWSSNRDLMTRKSSDEESTGAIATIRVNSDGTRWVRLLTQKALKREGTLMDHCIGGGSYDDQLDDPNYAYYSLRDAQNTPHVTLEVSGKSLIQCQGKGNVLPAPVYLQQVRHLVVEQEWSVPEFDENLNLDTLGLVEGRPHMFAPFSLFDADHLPPDWFEASSDLHLGPDATSIPQTLIVENCFSMDGCKVTALPKRLTAERILLSNLDNLDLGKGIFAGSLSIEHCSSITLDGPNLGVARVLIGYSSHIKITDQTPIRHLDLIKVSHTDLASIKASTKNGEAYTLVIGERLNCKHLEINEVSEIKFEGGTFDSIELNACSKTRIPEELKVDTLRLSETKDIIFSDTYALKNLTLIGATNVILPKTLTVNSLEIFGSDEIQMPKELNGKPVDPSLPLSIDHNTTVLTHPRPS